MLFAMLLSRLQVPRPAALAHAAARSLRAIAAQPAFRAAVLGATVGYAVMIMAMTATPRSAPCACRWGA